MKILIVSQYFWPEEFLINDLTLDLSVRGHEENVWIGESVSILAGVTIGKGSIIGANSVVSKTIPPYVIAVGCPATPIKKFNFETQIWEKF